jgi:NitT/TauT family transport system substrate-binding protein
VRRSTVIAAGIALYGANHARPVRAQALEKLHDIGPPTEDMTNAYWAVKTGLFARNGLDVELTPAANGTAALTAMIGGSYEICRASVPALFAAHLREIPVVIVAPALLARASDPFARLQVAPDSTVKTGSDLNGKTIGAPALNDLNCLATKAWVDKTGGNWRSLRFVEIPNSAMEAAIVSKRVDAAILQQPQLALSLSNGTTKTVGNGWAAIAPTFLAGAYAARIDWANAHADTLHKFNRVLTEATNYVNTHQKETEPLVAELTKLDLSAVAKMPRGFNAPTVEAAQLQPFIDASARYEHIARAFPAREVIWEGLR